VSELVEVDALARIMMKDRDASDTLSETTTTPELSEGTTPNAYGLCSGLQRGIRHSSLFRWYDLVTIQRKVR